MIWQMKASEALRSEGFYFISECAKNPQTLLIMRLFQDIKKTDFCFPKEQRESFINVYKEGSYNGPRGLKPTWMRFILSLKSLTMPMLFTVQNAEEDEILGH